jgi:precorrin-2 dehydrogenase/sirohydrochlorin ferrochelatase
MAQHQYPEIEGGGSLILAWQVKNKKVLVIGGGEVSLTVLKRILFAWRKELTLTGRQPGSGRPHP